MSLCYKVKKIKYSYILVKLALELFQILYNKISLSKIYRNYLLKKQWIMREQLILQKFYILPIIKYNFIGYFLPYYCNKIFLFATESLSNLTQKTNEYNNFNRCGP